ncbi:MAG: hypothetical protein QW692_04040, partial [Nitrososphaerota archaeon]
MLQRVAPVNPRAPTAIAAISMIIILLALSGSLIQAREADAMMKAIADFALAFPVTPPARDAGGDAASPPPIPLKAHAPEQLIAAAAGHRAEKPSPIIVVGGTRVDKPPAAERLSGIMMLDPREVFWKAEPWSRLNGLTAVTHRGNYTFLGNGTVVYRFREYGGYMHEMTIYYGLEPEAEPVSIRFTRLEDAAVEYELTRNDGASLQVSWFFTMPAPKTRIIAKNPPSDYRIYAVVRSANGIYSGGDGARAVIEFETESAPQVYSMMDEGVAEVKALSRNAVKIMFARNKPIIDPMLYVVAPSTVTVDWDIAGDRTLLTITDNLPAGNKIVLFALGWDDATGAVAQGYLKIMTGSVTLVQEGITHYLNYLEMRAKPVMLFAYHSNAPANAQYTFIVTVTTAATGTSTLHVQGMVILLIEPAFFTTGINTNIAAGATVTLATVNTNFPAGSKVAVLTYVQMGVTSTTGANRMYAAGNISILKGSTIVSQNQFQVGTYVNTQPAHVSLAYFDASSDANPSYSIQVYNSLSEVSQAWGEIIAFRVVDGAFLDTGSVALTKDSQVTVGSLSTSLSGVVGVIALAAAEYTYVYGLKTLFNAGDVVLQKDNQATDQITNQRGWYIGNRDSQGRSGIYALFRVDVAVSNPSYQVKMTARLTPSNGEAKILAFSFVWHVTVRYVVAEGGRAPEGEIILRYYLGSSLQRLVLSSSYQTIVVEHNSMINADFISSGSNQYERWAYAGGRNFTMTIISDVTLDLLYYNQLSVTLIPVTSKPYTSKTSPVNYARVNVTAFGAVFTLNVWENDTLVSAWVDRGGNVAWSMTTSGSTSTRRWATPGAVTLEGVNSPSVSTAIYYEQVRVTWRLVKNRMNITSIGPDNYFNASGKQFNGTLTLTGLYPGRDVSDWIDVYSIITVSSMSSGSRPDHWWALHPAGSSYNVSSPGTYVFKYEEWVLARIGDVLDADGDHSLSGAVSRLAMRNANGSAFYAESGDVLQLPYNMCNTALEAMWRGIWSRLNPPPPCFAPKSPLESFNFTHPNIWVLGDSGVEWYLDSDAGSRVFTWLYGKNSGTLIVIQDKNKGDSSYFYYGGYGRTPQYVYVEGSLVEN